MLTSVSLVQNIKVSSIKQYSKFLIKEMHTLKNIFYNVKKLGGLGCGAVTRKVHKNYFQTENEVMENVVGNFMTIGINLPDAKNVLTETALMKLSESIRNFDENKEVYVGILHGCGGNFCTGIVPSDEAAELGKNLIRTLQGVKKPLIAAMEGSTIDFGLYLSIMCDMRFMDRTALVGFRNKAVKLEVPSFLHERLIWTVGLTTTMEIMCSRKTWTATECLTFGFVNKVTDLGCALGQAMLLAQSIAFNNSLDDVIEQKSKILSFMKHTK